MDINVMTLDELEEMHESGNLELEINDGHISPVEPTMTDAEVEKLRDAVKAMTDDEQSVVVQYIEDEVIWAESKRRYFSVKDTIRRVRDALKG